METFYKVSFARGDKTIANWRYFKVKNYTNMYT